MNERNRPRGRIAALLIGVGLIVLPVVLGIFGRRNPEAEQLQASIAQGHEVRDLSIRGILLFGAGLVVMGACTLVVTTVLLIGSSRQGGISYPYPPVNIENAPTPVLPPEPRLEDVAGLQLQRLRAEQDALLHSYGWINQQAGTVHVPIERAIDLLLERGLPARPAGQSEFRDNGQQSPAYPSSGRQQENYP